MSISTLRTNFKSFSGRQDLSADECDYFINAGIRFLDHLQPMLTSAVSVDITLASAGYSYTLTGAYMVKKVQLYDTVEAEWVDLEEMKLDNMLASFPAVGSTDADEPAYWAYNNAASSDTTPTTINLLIMPPADASYSLRIHYEREAAELSDSATTNVWSEKYPDLCVLAAIMSLDEHYGNLDRRQAQLAAIMTKLDGIDKRVAEREAGYGMPVMERDTVIGYPQIVGGEFPTDAE